MTSIIREGILDTVLLWFIPHKTFKSIQKLYFCRDTFICDFSKVSKISDLIYEYSILSPMLSYSIVYYTISKWQPTFSAHISLKCNIFILLVDTVNVTVHCFDTTSLTSLSIPLLQLILGMHFFRTVFTFLVFRCHPFFVRS